MCPEWYANYFNALNDEIYQFEESYDFDGSYIDNEEYIANKINYLVNKNTLR